MDYSFLCFKNSLVLGWQYLIIKQGTYKECNRIADELRMLFHYFLDSPFFQVFSLIFFKMQDDFCSTPQWFT